MIGDRTFELACFPSARMEDDRGIGAAPPGMGGVALAVYRAKERARLIPGSVFVETYEDLPASLRADDSHPVTSVRAADSHPVRSANAVPADPSGTAWRDWLLAP